MNARNKYNNITKWLLHTKIGAIVGFYLGVRGYNRLQVKVIRANGSTRTLFPSFNSRVDVGAKLCAYLLSGTNLGSLTSPNYPKYIALSTTALTPAKTDTTLTGETSATGLGRTSVTATTYTNPSTLDGAASYVLTNTFTNSSAGAVTLNSSAIFDAASTGNMFVEANFTGAVTLQISDQIIITWTVNF